MKRSGFDWWKLYHRRFWDSDEVLAMPPEVAGIYVFLLGEQALRGALPADHAAVRALCSRFDAKVWRRAWAILEPLFPVEADGKRRNSVQKAELEEVEESRVLHRERQAAYRKRREDAEAPTDNGVTDSSGDEHVTVTPPSRDVAVTLERRGEERRVEETRARDARTRAREAPPDPPGEDSPLRAAEAAWERTWSETRTEAGRPAVWRWTPVERGKLRFALEHLADGDAELLTAKVDGLLLRGDAWQMANASPTVLVAQWHRVDIEPPPAVEPVVRGPQRVLTGEAAADEFLRERCTAAEEIA